MFGLCFLSKLMLLAWKSTKNKVHPELPTTFSKRATKQDLIEKNAALETRVEELEGQVLQLGTGLNDTKRFFADYAETTSCRLNYLERIALEQTGSISIDSVSPVAQAWNLEDLSL
jgi:hypothetical protein